ncbi:MAG: DoxX family protein [Hyphomicrobium sp.]|nr:DoxX family protein [Hyphomicrobium sp.]
MSAARRRAGLWLSARLLLASAFLASGVMKVIDFTGAVAEVRALTGMEPASPIAALVILTQLGGSALLLIGGRSTVIGAFLLASFTFAATVLGHAFWTKAGPQQARDLVTFLEHMGLIGGFVLVALLSRGGAVDDRR